MEIYSSPKKKQIKEFIEILNDLGLTVVYINSEFYVSNEFETSNESIDINESVVSGRDVTDIVENNIDNRNISEHRKKEIQNQIHQLKQVRRRFHKNISYVVYSGSF